MVEHASKTSSSVYDALSDLIGLPMNSDSLRGSLEAMFGTGQPEPEIKVYSDCVYANYYAAGISLLFSPMPGYRPNAASLHHDKLRLESIYLYNKQSEKSNKNQPFKAFSLFPLSISTPNGVILDIVDSTTGKEMVEALGEPPRKGGGSGPSSGSIDIWCEWPGLMVEFSQRGPQAWERGKDAAWKIITIFSRTEPGG